MLVCVKKIPEHSWLLYNQHITLGTQKKIQTPIQLLLLYLSTDVATVAPNTQIIKGNSTWFLWLCGKETWLTCNKKVLSVTRYWDYSAKKFVIDYVQDLVRGNFNNLSGILFKKSNLVLAVRVFVQEYT